MSDKCPSCGELYINHLGLIPLCYRFNKALEVVDSLEKQLAIAKAELDKLHELDELREENKMLRNNIAMRINGQDEIKKLQAENARLREALERIAIDWRSDWTIEQFTNIAREALGAT